METILNTFILLMIVFVLFSDRKTVENNIFLSQSNKGIKKKIFQIFINVVYEYQIM